MERSDFPTFGCSGCYNGEVFWTDFTLFSDSTQFLEGDGVFVFTNYEFEWRIEIKQLFENNVYIALPDQPVRVGVPFEIMLAPAAENITKVNASLVEEGQGYPIAPGEIVYHGSTWTVVLSDLIHQSPPPKPDQKYELFVTWEPSEAAIVHNMPEPPSIYARAAGRVSVVLAEEEEDKP